MRKDENQKYRLFLDDIRIPTDVSMYITTDLRNEYRIYSWEIVRSFNEFVQFISEHGLPTHISFDHDIHFDHYMPDHYWEDYNKSKAYQESRVYTEKTGADCARWLCEYLIETDQRMPICFVHSQNPVGADNIKSILNTFNKVV